MIIKNKNDENNIILLSDIASPKYIPGKIYRKESLSELFLTSKKIKEHRKNILSVGFNLSRLNQGSSISWKFIPKNFVIIADLSIIKSAIRIFE